MSKVTNGADTGLMGKAPPNKGNLAFYTAASTRNSTDKPCPTGPAAVYLNVNQTGSAYQHNKDKGGMQKL